MRPSLGRMSNAQSSKQKWHHEKEFQSLACIKMHQRESNIFYILLIWAPNHLTASPDPFACHYCPYSFPYLLWYECF